MFTRTLHPQFPLGVDAACVPGAQPKLLVRREGGVYVSGPAMVDVIARFEYCDDLAQQLCAYTLKKGSTNPEWTVDFNVERTRRGVQQRIDSGAWELSPAELDWIMDRVREAYVAVSLSAEVGSTPGSAE
jgi:hypothetical protein